MTRIGHFKQKEGREASLRQTRISLAVEETKKTQGCIGEKKEEGVVIHPTVSQTQCGEHATRRDAEAAAEVFVGPQGRRTEEGYPKINESFNCH
jgi:hypothetical protein